MGKSPWKINAVNLLASLRLRICLKFLKRALMKLGKNMPQIGKGGKFALDCL
jgi:hypothetical protein